MQLTGLQMDALGKLRERYEGEPVQLRALSGGDAHVVVRQDEFLIHPDGTCFIADEDRWTEHEELSAS